MKTKTDRPERLDKLLAHAGFGSRKEVKNLLAQGQVTYLGEVVKDPKLMFSSNQLGDILCSNKPLRSYANSVFMLHKPAGYLSALSDAHAPTIADLLPAHLQKCQLSPVGRLDKDTTGLLLLTNDGQLSHRLTSPKWHVAKIYVVTTAGLPWSDTETELFAAGLTLSNGSTCLPAELNIVSDHCVELTLYEGKFHQVKLMCSQVERPVLTLHRKQVATLVLDESLKPGELRELTDLEASTLRRQVEL